MTSSTSNSERPAPRRGPVMLAVAVLLPLLVLAGTLRWFWRPATELVSPAAAKMDQRLAQTRPDVLILGNSMAIEGLDSKALSQSLTGSSVLNLAVFASPPPVWYAILKNRVQAGGYRPHVIVVVGSLGFFEQADVRSSLQVDALAQQVGTDEPVITAKTYGRAATLIPDRVRLRTSDMRDGLIEDGRLSLLRLRGLDGAAAEDAANLASEAVFEAQGAIDMSLHKRVIPVVEIDRSARRRRQAVNLSQTYVPDLIDLADELGSRIVFVRAPLPPSTLAGAPPRPKLVHDLIASLNQRGAGWLDLTVLQFPESVFKDATHVNAIGREAFTSALASMLIEVGAMGDGPIDHAAVPVVTDAVRRVGPVPPLPALDLTAAQLVAPCRYSIAATGIGYLESSRMAHRGWAGGEPLQVLQDGEPLKRVQGKKGLGEGCTGTFFHDHGAVVLSPRGSGGDIDSLAGLDLHVALEPAAVVVSPSGKRRTHWLYGGSSLVFGVTDGLPEQATELVVTAEIDLAKVQDWPADAVPGWIQVKAADGSSLGRVELRRQPDAALGTAGATLTVAAPSGPVEIFVTAAPELPPTVLVSLGVGTVEGQEAAPLSWLVGRPADAVSIRVLGGSAFKPDITGPRPRVPGDHQVLASSDPAIGKIRLPAVRFLDRYKVNKSFGDPNCSPLAVLEDGVPLPKGNKACDKVRSGKPGPGAYCHEGKKILFRSTDGTEPASGGHSYDVVFDQGQRCKGAWWLYPGQTLKRKVKGSDLQPLRRSADTLVFAAHGFKIGDQSSAVAPVVLKLKADGVVVVQRQLSMDDLDGKLLRLSLPQPVTRSSKKVQLVVRSGPGGPVVLVAQASLERAEEAGAEEAADQEDQEDQEEGGTP